MRCNCCDRNLNNYESTLRLKSTGEYADMCLKCIKESGVGFQGNNAHEPFSVADDMDNDAMDNNEEENGDDAG